MIVIIEFNTVIDIFKKLCFFDGNHCFVRFIDGNLSRDPSRVVRRASQTHFLIIKTFQKPQVKQQFERGTVSYNDTKCFWKHHNINQIIKV